MMKQLASLCIILLAVVGVCSVEAITTTTKRRRRNLLGTGVGVCQKVSETKYETIFVSPFKAAFLLTQNGYKQGACSDRCQIYCLSYDTYTIASYNCICYNEEKTINISDRGGTKGNIISQRLGNKEATTGGLDPRFPSATLIDPASTDISPSFTSILNRVAPAAEATANGKMMGGMMMRGSHAPRAPRAMNGAMMMKPASSTFGSTIISLVSNVRSNGIKPLTGTETTPVSVTNRFIAPPPAIAPVSEATTTTITTTTSSTPVGNNKTTPTLEHETTDPRISTKNVTVDPPATTKEFGVCGNNAVIDHTILDCKCLPGYTGDATMGCYDINECKSLDNVCADYDNSHCVNLKGSYTCQCDDGYTGNPLNGTQCRSLNQCDSPYGNPCGPDITCKPTDDGYECIEPDDAESCPVICSPSMECKAVTDPVEAKQHKYKCVCKKGYVQTSPYFPCRLPTSSETIQGQSNDRT